MLQNSNRKADGIRVNESVLSKIKMNRSSQRSNDDLRGVAVPMDSISSSRIGSKFRNDKGKLTKEL